jgi:hypothetical protein
MDIGKEEVLHNHHSTSYDVIVIHHNFIGSLLILHYSSWVLVLYYARGK